MSDRELLQKALNAAKNFENFDDVLMAVCLHPEWLTIIPRGRQWAILHQIILSGNVIHLMQLLHLQKSNPDFRLLTNTADGKSVLDVAKMHPDATAMYQRVEELIKLDEMLNYARECKWDECYKIVKENPAYFNEKPPYRRFYVIHQLIFADNIEVFKRFQQIDKFFFDFIIRFERQKINIFARKNNCVGFAKYLEEQYPVLLSADDSDSEGLSEPSKDSVQETNNVSSMLQQVAFTSLDDKLLGGMHTFKSRSELSDYLGQIQSDQQTIQRQNSDATVKAEEETYKKKLMDNLMCPLSTNVLVDPGR